MICIKCGLGDRTIYHEGPDGHWPLFEGFTEFDEDEHWRKGGSYSSWVEYMYDHLHWKEDDLK